MNKIQRNVDRLECLLDLEREIVGVRFLFSEEEFNESQFRPLKNKMSYCTTVSRATQGNNYKIRLENFACSAAANALGLYKMTPIKEFGYARLRSGTYDNLGVSRQVSKSMVYCPEGMYGLEVAPLREFVEGPHIVIFITNPFNAMRISQGYAYFHGHVKNVQFAGMQALCQECTSYPFEMDTLNISMMCSGTRMLGRWSDSELGIGLPFHLLDSLVEGIKKTVNPLERNKRKKVIEERLQEKGLSDELSIEYDKNYDDGLYMGIPETK